MAVRDETLRFKIETAGQGEILQLGREIVEVEKAAGAAEADLSAFVDELDRLNQQAADASRLQQLEQQIGELAPRLDDAERAALALKLQLGSVAEPSRDMQRAFEAANRELTALRSEQTRYSTEASTLSQRLQQVGLATDGLDNVQRQLAQSASTVAERFIQQQRAARETAARLADGDERFRRFAASSRASAEALERFRARANVAANEQNRLNDSTQRGIGIFDRLRGALAAVGVALGLREAGQAVVGIARIGDEAERTRIRLEGLYGTQEEANRVFGELRQIADENGQSFDAITEAAARLKGFGLDPLDGTLQSLIDQNAKLGGSQEQLEGIILAVGQAWAKQKLQGEEILQLNERGIPVWDLLTKATGKSVEEIRRLSEAGELGRDVIQQLLQEIGRSADGAASASINTLSSQFQLLRNRAQEFFEEVADAGVLDFFKQQLSSLNAEIRRLTADGTLTQYAKSVSDGIVATAEAVKSAVVFVRDYSGALLLLGKAYLAVRFAPFIAGLAASAQGMVAAAVQARTLTGVVGGLGARLAAIPANIKIAIGIIAFDFLMGQFKRLNEAINAYQQSLLELESFEASQRQYARDRAALIEEVIRVYGKYADTQIKTQEQLNALGEGDLILYRQRLEAAERYFTAVQAKAKEANDAAALEDAQRRLGEFKTALDVVAEGFARIDRAKKAAFADQSQARDLADALKELGVSAQNAGNTITEEGEKILGVFARIVVNAESTGAQIGEAFNNALGRSQTVAEVERLGELLKTAFDKGRLSAEQFNTLMDATKARIKGIEDAASKAAGSFQQIVDAGEEATRALLATLDASRSQLAAKANQLAAEIARGIREGVDTSALRGELAQVEGQIDSTTAQINEASGALDRFAGSSDRAANSLGGISSAAGGASGALRSVEQAADESFGNIGQGASTVAGGPLAALGAEFGRIRDKALALGDAAKEAFDSTLQVGETVRGTGFTIEQFYQRQIDRLALAERTTQELATAYNNSASQAERLATATGEVAQNAALSLEAERERNLEYARQLLEIEQGRAQAQQAAAAGLAQQVSLTRELAAARESLPPEVIEVRAKNQQKPGELLSEVSEPQLDALTARIVQRLSVNRRGVFG